MLCSEGQGGDADQDSADTCQEDIEAVVVASHRGQPRSLWPRGPGAVRGHPGPTGPRGGPRQLLGAAAETEIASQAGGRVGGRALAELCGLSVNTISLVERGKTSAAEAEAAA